MSESSESRILGYEELPTLAQLEDDLWSRKISFSLYEKTRKLIREANKTKSSVE